MQCDATVHLGQIQIEPKVISPKNLPQLLKDTNLSNKIQIFTFLNYFKNHYDMS